jgi:non-specific protein-tyrosine kinase
MDQQIQKATADLAALSTSINNQNERDRLETTLAQYRQTYAALLQSYESIRLAEANSTSNVVQAEPASSPARPIKPRVLTNTLLAAVVGLLLAVGIAFLVEAMDDTIRNPGDVTQQLGLPVLGAIAKYDYEDDNPITTTQPRAPVAEAFRSLRTNIQFASVDSPLHTVLVTSPSPEDGKSTVAVNLGVVLAQSGRKVVILDADLHRPKVHKIIRLVNRRGLSDLFVQNQVNLDGAVQKTDIQNYYALTSGSLPPNPSELLGSEKMVDIIHQLKDQAELVVIDTPPVLAVTDACVLAPRVDGVLLIIKPGVTKLAACKQAIEQLRHVGAKILGVVLNEIEIKRSRYYYYHYRGYYYAYYDSYGESPSGNNHKSKIGNGKAKSKAKNPR